jgi:predicted transcriptional regulator YdeE
MEKETFKLENDIKVFCVAAKSFPDGILESHQKLHSLVPLSDERKYFGISWWGENGNIIYKAAAEEIVHGELSKHGLEEFIIPNGEYLYITVKDFMQNIPAIGKAFEELTPDPRIDPKGACIEWYLPGNECRCMMKLKEN